MVTTAYRSVLAMRKLGFYSETVEHRLGRFIRKDLFGFADGIAFKEGIGIILFQAYHKKETENHKHLNPNENKTISEWVKSGGIFEHHVWSFKIKNGRKYWTMERKVMEM